MLSDNGSANGWSANDQITHGGSAWYVIDIRSSQHVSLDELEGLYKNGWNTIVASVLNDLSPHLNRHFYRWNFIKSV